MADEVNSTAGEPDAAGRPPALEAIASEVRKTRGIPPVHLWNPEHCGDIGLKIARDGTWSYQNSPIGRKELVRLFSTILRRDPEGHVLVTPVEKIAVEVEDAPFLAVEMQVRQGPLGQVVQFRTNVDDEVEVGPDHPLRFDTGPSSGIKPYVRVRADLWALVTRALVYDLVALAQTREVDGRARLGVVSEGQFFVMADATDETEGERA